MGAILVIIFIVLPLYFLLLVSNFLQEKWHDYLFHKDDEFWDTFPGERFDPYNSGLHFPDYEKWMLYRTYWYTKKDYSLEKAARKARKEYDKMKDDLRNYKSIPLNQWPSVSYSERDADINRRITQMQESYPWQSKSYISQQAREEHEKEWSNRYLR